ncbi:hypothetical protein [Methanolapillus millepedarum]
MAIQIFFIPLTAAVPSPITGQPQNQAVFETENASFTVTFSGIVSLYQWQVRHNGGDFVSVSDGCGGNTGMYEIKTTADMNGWEYKVAIDDDNGRTHHSSSAALIVFSNPSDKNISEHESATFEVTENSSYDYAWLEDRGDGSGFLPLLGSSGYQFSIPDATSDMNGYKYKVQISGPGINDYIESGAATLTVNNGPVNKISSSGGYGTENVKIIDKRVTSAPLTQNTNPAPSNNKSEEMNPNQNEQPVVSNEPVEKESQSALRTIVAVIFFVLIAGVLIVIAMNMFKKK